MATKDKLNRSKTNSLFQSIAKESDQKARTIQFKMLHTDFLLDYPNNNEDIQNTTDLETSISQLGFTDPIEVTDFNMAEGFYTILSGHRRRIAAVRQNIHILPCIIKHFNSDKDLENYVLMANNHRDSAKDPLLLCKRYKMHEEYLKNSGFKGRLGDEIAKRLGLSKQQADRYKAFNKIIQPVWDLVQKEAVGMSSLLPMSSHSIEEQNEIFTIVQQYFTQQDTSSISRETCNKIIKGYRSGKKTYQEIFYENLEDTTPVLNKIIDEYDEKDMDYATNKDHLVKEIKKTPKGKDVLKHIHKLENYFKTGIEFDRPEEAESAIYMFSSLTKILLDEINRLTTQYPTETQYQLLNNLQEEFKLLQKNLNQIPPLL